MKAESTAVGWLALIPGLSLCLGTGAFLMLALLLRVPVAIPLVLAAGLIAVLGVFLTGFGFNLVARDTAPWFDGVGQWMIRAVRAWRGKNGTPGG
jgi:hypothetical protein